MKTTIQVTLHMHFPNWKSESKKEFTGKDPQKLARKWLDNCCAICGTDERGNPYNQAYLTIDDNFVIDHRIGPKDISPNGEFYLAKYKRKMVALSKKNFANPRAAHENRTPCAQELWLKLVQEIQHSKREQKAVEQHLNLWFLYKFPV